MVPRVSALRQRQEGVAVRYPERNVRNRWELASPTGSVPTLVAALKVNAGLSLVGVVVGEFQSANLGLGYLIQYGSQIFKMNIVMTGITILAIVSSVMYLAILGLEAAVMRRR